MQTGTLTTDNLTQVLRSISQRKRHGVLEITCDRRQLTVFVMQGDIIEASWDGQPPLEDLLSHLERAGISTDGAASATTPAEAFEALTDESGLDKISFKFAARQRLLGRFEELDLSSECFYAFRIQAVPYDPTFSPRVAVSEVLQLLLDRDRNSDRVTKMFGAENYIKMVSEGGSAAQELGDEERVILGLIREALPVEEVKIRSILCAFSFNKALLALAECGLVQGIDRPIAVTEVQVIPEAGVLTGRSHCTIKPAVESVKPEVCNKKPNPKLNNYWAALLLLGGIISGAYCWPKFLAFW